MEEAVRRVEQERLSFYKVNAIRMYKFLITLTLKEEA